MALTKGDFNRGHIFGLLALLKVMHRIWFIHLHISFIVGKVIILIFIEMFESCRIS